MLAEDADGCEHLLREEKGIWEFDTRTYHSRSLALTILPWALSLFFLCTTILAFQSRPSCSTSAENESYETGFSTDFIPSGPPIPINIIPTTFTSNLRYNTTSKSLYNEPLSKDEVQYISSGLDVDANWHELLHDQYVAISATEAAQFPEAAIQEIWWNGEERYYMELQVFHNLHCLNELRSTLAMNGGGHEGEGMDGDERVHLEHCLDQVRQALICHADLTPVPMRPIDGGGRVLGNAGVHMCRDFDAIRFWVRERGLETKALGDS